MRRLRNVAWLVTALALAVPVAAVGAEAGAGTDTAGTGTTAPPVAAPPALTAPDVASASRDLDDQDPSPSADAMASLTRSSSGVVTETPASAALSAVIAQGDGAERGGIGASPEAAGGKGLAAVKNATLYPYRAVGQVYVTYGKNTYVCTGTLIGPSSVATPAICLYGIEGQPVWADAVEFYPAVNNNQAPYSSYKWDTASIMKGFTDPTLTSGLGGGLPFGIGLVILAQPAGDKLGWFGFQTDPNDTYQPSALSYGDGKAQNNMSSGTCTIDASLMWRSFAISNPCPAMGWGTPLYVTEQGDKSAYLTAMNIWKNDDGSTTATRVSPIIYQWLVDNRK